MRSPIGVSLIVVSSVSFGLACTSTNDHTNSDGRAAPGGSTIIYDPDWRMAPDSLALAEHRLRLLGFLAWKYRQDTGRFPEQLDEVLLNVDSLSSHRAELDPWGRKVTYTVLGDSVMLVSAGPDTSRTSSSDDIRIVVRDDPIFSASLLR